MDTAPLNLRFDCFELDERQARLTHDGRPIALPPKAFAVLCALGRQPGQLVTKDALLDAVWGHQYVSDSVLKTTISELRAALEDDAKQPRYIETASRRGYRFIARSGMLRSAASVAWRKEGDALLDRQVAGKMGTVPVSEAEAGTAPFIGREAARGVGARAGGRAAGRLGHGRGGRRQDEPQRHLSRRPRAGHRDRRPVRRGFRHGRALSTDPRGRAGAVPPRPGPARWHARGR